MGAQERKRQRRIKEYVVNRDGSLCCYCDRVLTDETVTMEHIVPDSKRGTFNTTNLTVSCSKCNNKRGNKPFFEYCVQFNWPLDKVSKYKVLYFNNLRIKVLNIAKEEVLKDRHEEEIIPNVLIKQACQILKIKSMDFDDYEKEYQFEIKFGEICERKKIKFCFEQLIRIIEADCE
ncbi:MAG TPA: HNH endonuclease [Candidatus Saccharimonadales bacterium]